MAENFTDEFFRILWFSNYLLSLKASIYETYYPQSERAFHANFLHEKSIFFLLIFLFAIFLVLLSLENSENKKNTMRSLERLYLCSFSLRAINT